MNPSLADDVLEASIDELEYLSRSKHRLQVLNALSADSRERTDLRTMTGASSPTMGRILSDFQERRWIRRDGATYELTRLGAFVAVRSTEFCESMATERKLRNVWQWLPLEMEGFSVDLFADAVVSYPGPGYPYEPIERMNQLMKNTERVRGFGTVVLKSGSLETVCGAVIAGMEMEFVFSTDVLEATLAWNAERMVETADCENCRLFVHDDLPDGDRCGLNIVDDRVAICGHDPESGALRAIIDTGAAEAREWAISLFEQLRRESSPVETTSDRSLRSERLSA